MRERMTADESGERLGDYQLQRRLAEGGMGVVWLARQVSLQRTVAVKMIRSGLLATPAEVERFRREAEAAAALDHPNIVPVYEIGEDGGRHFFSMKFLEGGNLAELSASCDPDTRRSVAWMRRAAGLVSRMARAVHHAHQRGVLHRDIKPTNVLLDEEGTPHLTDFGLAKLTDRDIGMTQTVMVMGTPGYMAPEQAAGNTAQVTIAADVYSLGAVLYELLSGRPPFEGGSTLEVLRMAGEQEPLPMRRHNPRLSRDLETICLKCLHREPASRFVSAEEVAADLERWLAGQPILARPVGSLEKVRLWWRRHPAVAIAVLLLLALAAVSTVAAVRLREQRDEINESLRSSLLAQAQVLRLGTAPGRRAESLRVVAAAVRIRPSMEARNEAIAALALPDLGPPQTWHAARPQRHTPQRMLSADGERYVLFGQSNGLTVHRRTDGAVIAELTTPPDHLFSGKLSPDGRYVMNYDRHRNVFVWDLNRPAHGPREHSVMLPGPWAELSPGFTPDSRLLALAGSDKTIRFFEMESGKERKQVELPVVPERISISPGGDYVAVSAGTSFVVSKINPAGAVRIHKHHSPVTSFAWHPEGRFIAVGYHNGDVQLLDTLSEASRGLTPHQRDVSVAFDVRGEFVASSSFDGIQRFADPATGHVLFETQETGELQATSDGRYFGGFRNDGSIGAREIHRSSVFRTLTSAVTGYPLLSGVDISPDGRWLVAGDGAGLHVWSLRQGNEVAFTASSSAKRPQFHPGGDFIVTGGDGGQQRWPFHVTPDGKEVRAGPPETISAADGAGVHFTPDGQWFAIPGREGSQVMNWSNPAQCVHFGQNLRPNRHNRVVLSPDRNWTAGASRSGVGVTVWNARDGSMLRHLIELDNAELALSADGRTLATATAAELILWDSATWQPRRRIATGLSGEDPGPVVFSRDGTLFAAALTRHEIHLFDPRTGDPLAILTPPVRVALETLAFSADGRCLAAQTLGPVIHLWELHTLRRELRTRRLDW
jgi:WD40 repeat protein/tRNA A-37 threonylcarbamoyl transferase component Bud32